MFYVVDTKKSFDEAAKDLEIEVTSNSFGVLHIHNLGETLRTKGIDYKEECKVFEICNPVQANKILTQEMLLNTALPCRISVYTENKTTKIALIKPSEMFKTLTKNETVIDLTKEIEDILVNIIDNTK